MQYKQRPTKFTTPPPVGLRPGQDIYNPKAAPAFPAVGVTLRSYKHDPFENLQTAPVKPQTNATRVKKRRFNRLRSAVTLKRTVITLLLLMLLTGGWVGGKFLYNAHKLFGGNIFNALSTTKLKGEDSGRVNILLAGNSADDVGHNGADLTDSILLLSIDTKTNQAFMMSIPRDLWVDIPGAGHEKINDAYVVGENNNFSETGYPNGGMGQLEQVVEQNFGIPIDYYALIDYNALKQAVNSVGGINVNIQSSDPRGLYDPSIDYATNGPLVKLTNGQHTLNGEQALDLARARGDAYGSYGFEQSDFERTSNQRMMLLAIKSKATSLGVLSNPTKLTGLFDAVGGNVKTDFTLSEVHRLYDITKNINGGSIKSIGLNNVNGKNLLASYTSEDGESALIPATGIDDFSQIQLFMKQLTSSNPVAREGAQVVVLNATETNGLASKKRSALVSKNLDVTTVADAAADQATTTIIDASGGTKPASLALLKQILGPTATVTTVNPYSGVYQADFIVLLGADQVTSQTTSD